jgi:hypothetical protein
MLRCSVVGKWIAEAVGAETGKLIKDYKVFGGISLILPIWRLRA